jgi:hypothetical protein
VALHARPQHTRLVRKPWVRPAPPQQRINNVIRPSSTYGEGPLLGPLLECDRGRKCLVLDLDETLVHSSFRPVPNPDYILPVEIEGIVHNVYVLKRPGCDEFLYRCGMCYEVVVFTASLAKVRCRLGGVCWGWLARAARLCPLCQPSCAALRRIAVSPIDPLLCACFHPLAPLLIPDPTPIRAPSQYADPLLDLLDPHNVIRARLFREACVQHEGSFVKDMSMLGRDPTDVIIVDNSPASYLFQPENALPCDSYIDNPADRELWLLADLLETIQRVVDVRDALQRWVTGALRGAAAGEGVLARALVLLLLLLQCCGRPTRRLLPTCPLFILHPPPLTSPLPCVCPSPRCLPAGTYAGLHGLAVLPPESEVFYVEEEVEVSGDEEGEGEEDALSGDSEGEDAARVDHARGVADCSDADSLAGDGHGKYAHEGGAGADATLELSDEEEGTGTGTGGGGGGGPRRHGRGGHLHGHGRTGTEGGGVSSVRSSLSSADTGSAAAAGGGYEPGTPAEGTASSAGVHGGRGGLLQEDGGSPAFAHGPGAGLGQQPQPQLQPHQSMYRANMPPLQERGEAGAAGSGCVGVPDGARAVNPLARMSAVAGAERGSSTRSSTVAGGSSGGPSRAESPVGTDASSNGGIANGTVARNAMGGGGGGEAPLVRTSLSLSSAAAGSGAGVTPTSSAGLASSGAGAMPHRPSHSAAGAVSGALGSAAGGAAGVGAKPAAGADESAGRGAGVSQTSAGRLGSGKHRESEEGGVSDEEKRGSGGQQQHNGGHRSRSSSKHATGGEAAAADAGRRGSHDSDRLPGKFAEGESGGGKGAPPAGVTLRPKQSGSGSGAPSATASPSSSTRYITSL